MKANVAIACGGTGGHLFPGLAVAEELMGRGHQVRLYVSSKEIDRKVMEEYENISAIELPAVGWPGLGLKSFTFARRLVTAYGICSREVESFKPSAVVGMGGFTCAPLLFSAIRHSVPAFIHESNAIPGKVTRWLAPRMRKVLLGLPQCQSYLSSSETVVTGTPVRRSLVRISREEAIEHWDLDPGKKTILVMGGSQGARGINEMVIRALPALKEYAGQWQFIHISGNGDENLVTMNYRKNGCQAAVMPFCTEMAKAYSATDLVVARSGAASITEIGTFSLPGIFVPYPHAAENHQLKNALTFEEHGAGRIVPEGENGGERLAATVINLMNDANLLWKMAEKSGELHHRDAVKRIVNEVEDVF